MAKTYQQVIEQAEQIRTETAQWANTAQRVGGTIKDAVELAHTDTEARKSEITVHTGRTDNPHSVTKSQVGLANVNNTSDRDKPISTAQQAAFDSINQTIAVMNVKTEKIKETSEVAI